MEPLTINNRRYRWPARPVVVICADGCDPEYLECGFRDGILPNFSKLISNGMLATASWTSLRIEILIVVACRVLI